MEPDEFTALVKGIRAIETMLAHPVDKNAMAERLRDMKGIFEKSVASLTDIPAGAVITADMVGMKKPGTGIPARKLRDVIGRRVRRDVVKDTLLREEDLDA